MRKRAFAIAVLTSLIFGACQNNEKKKEKLEESVSETKATSVPFTIGKNFFVKNTVESIDKVKLETQEEFNQIFGIATVMGKDGKPTPIDFSKQYVIAISEPTTEFATRIKNITIVKNTENEIIVDYKVETGEKQTFLTTPCCVLIIDKSYDGIVVLLHEHEH